jgi:type VI secretion system secreted protein Hcp
MSPVGGSSPEDGIRRFRFRVVATDGRELISDVVEVNFPNAEMVGYPPLAVVASTDDAAKPVEKETPAFPVRAIFVSGRGQKLGALKGESERANEKDRFQALSLEYDVGWNESGRRQHHPLELTKEWGAASPQLFSALTTNEVLEVVQIDCYGVSPSGEELIAHTVKLTNATVIGIKQFVAQQGGGPAAFETIGFAFEKIEHQSPKGKVLASDEIAKE